MLEHWGMTTEPGNRHISWDLVQRRAGEAFRSVEVDVPSMPEHILRVVEIDGVPTTSTEGIVEGAVWKFRDRFGNVCAWVEIAEVIGLDSERRKLFRAKVDVGAANLTVYEELPDRPYFRWVEKARSRGVPEDLVALGCRLMSQAAQNKWSGTLQKECGWRDAGDAMIELALQKPEHARQRWAWLMATDGGRGNLDEATGEWEVFQRDPTQDQ